MMMIIKILLLSWFISTFEAIQWLLQEVKWKWIKITLIAITGCFKCSSLFIGLILSQDIWTALTASVIASILQIIKNKLKI
jgi:hypothetical protein